MVDDYKKTFNLKRLWWILTIAMIVMIGILLFFGREIYHAKPPIPAQVVSQSGEVIFTRDDILNGQNIWQSVGGMQQGSVWGHGSYLAPDWSADWLHREASALLEIKRSQFSLPEITSEGERRAMHHANLVHEMRTNSYDDATDTLVVSNERAIAIKQVQGTFYQPLYR